MLLLLGQARGFCLQAMQRHAKDVVKKLTSMCLDKSCLYEQLRVHDYTYNWILSCLLSGFFKSQTVSKVRSHQFNATTFTQRLC